ncbi:hypothetical protein GCM10009837_02140 [Streptomyces durmitorensis]|uniref:Uncharacterized protein n=1 Tax=Streptomyces durmitorensis TaxID=319947 RepID=A0ABY4Q0U3_9ACTN|nr:hypothetical protein [Streptomyces durmitorensis]UQT59701.1 hypothetical protein M4V62_34140 [Streptomyces durmitorensis]
MGKKRPDREGADASMGDGHASGEGARWIGNTNAPPERRQPADKEAPGPDAVEEAGPDDGGKSADDSPPDGRPTR